MVWTKKNIPQNKTINGIVSALSEDEKQYFVDLYNSAPSELENNLMQLRTKRNNLLAKTDWTASSDLVMSDEMKTYRQQLRDATEGLDTVEKIEAYTFPKEVTK